MNEGRPQHDSFVDLGLSIDEHPVVNDSKVYSIIDGELELFHSGGLFGKSDWKQVYAVLTNLSLMLFEQRSLQSNYRVLPLQSLQIKKQDLKVDEVDSMLIKAMNGKEEVVLRTKDINQRQKWSEKITIQVEKYNDIDRELLMD